MFQNIKLYRVNQERYLFKDTSTRLERIKVIVKYALKSYKCKDKSPFEEIPYFSREGINYHLFVYNFPDAKSSWNKFLPHELTAEYKFDVLNFSLILFIDDGNDIYITIGGSSRSYQAIAPFIDHSFGLTFISKIIVPEKDVIVSISSRGLTGSRSGITEQFTNDFKIIDFIKFGKVPKETDLILNEESSRKYFGFIQKKVNEKIKIYAGKSLLIKKDVDFDTYHKTVQNLGEIMKQQSNDYLSSYVEVTSDRVKDEQLIPLLIRELFDDLEHIGRETNVKNRRFKFDFCHPERMVEFYEADRYILKEKDKDEEKTKKYNEFARVNNKDDIYEAVMRHAKEVVGNNDYFDFRAYIQGVLVSSYAGGSRPITAGFTHHFTAEFPYENDTAIFLVDTKWFILKKTFIEDLKFECVQSIKNHKLPKHILDIPWDKAQFSTEKEYNLQYLNKKKYIVLDTFTPDGIELCDILYVDEGITYLIHVKYGFESKIRELGNQIAISAKRFREDQKTGFSYVKKVYKRAKQHTNVSESEFVGFFKQKIVYVLAFASHLSEDLLVETNIEKYRSNIARYSLIQCNKDMQSFNYELNICQIRRE